MQDVTPWPESFDVSEPVARVLVDGQEVDVESVTVSSELDTALPEMVSSGGGSIVAATGTASILPGMVVSESGYDPWGDPQNLVGASEVVVEAGYRDPVSGVVGCARQVTGNVDALSGGALSQGVSMDFVDFATAFDRDITIEPLLQQYPNRYDGGPRMGVGLSALYVTNRVVRHCGFYSTPQMIPQALVSAPLFGSGVAERGWLASGVAHSGAPSSAAFWGTSWGLGLSDGVLEYEPNYGVRGHGRLTSTLHVSFLRDDPPSGGTGFSRINLLWGSSRDAVHVYAHGNGDISVRYRDDGTVTTVATLRITEAADAEVFTVLVTPAGEATIYASNGAVVSGSATLPSTVTSSDMSLVVAEVPADAPMLGGVQVAFSSTRNHMFERTAHFPGAIYRSMLAFPSQIRKNCMSLLKEQSEAELTAMWIDEFGHFRWVDRHRLAGAVPSGTLTSQDNLLDLQWSFPVRSVFSRVMLEYEEPRVTRRTVASVTVGEGRGSSLSNDDSETRFFEPPADEDWHMVEPPNWLGGTVSYTRLRRGHGSYYGGLITTDDGDSERLAYSSRLTRTWDQINPQRWVYTASAHGLAGSEFIEQQFRDRPDLYGKFAGEGLPLIRARGLVQWEPEELTGSTLGPARAPVYVHQVGPWVQNANNLQALADFLAGELTEPDIILRDVPIVPDPRIQLGDTFWLVDQSVYNIRLRIVVMGKTLTYETTGHGVEMSQRITCKVVEAQQLAATYQDLADAWEPLSYSSLQAAWASGDYDALEANPLDRS